MNSSDAPPDRQTADSRFAMVPMATVPRLAKLKPAAGLVYLTLRGHANRRGTCWPSTDAIRAITGLNGKTIGKAFAELETAGILRREKRNGTTNLFHLLDGTTDELPSPKGPPNGGDPNLEGPPNGGATLRQTAEPPSAKRRTGTDHRTDQGTNQLERGHAASAAPAPAPSDASPQHPASAVEGDSAELPSPPAGARQSKPPTLDQVKAYAVTRANGAACAEPFFDHYVANGWMVGKTRMKDWQASFRNWMRREPEIASSRQNSHRPATRPQVTTPDIPPLPTRIDRKKGT